MSIATDFVVFDAVDRCDRCGAQAVAQAELSEPQLLFCGHCTRKFQDALLSQGYTIRWDETKEYY